MLQEFLKIDYFLFKIINIYANNKILDILFSFFHDAHKNIYILIFFLFLILFLIYKNKLKRISLILMVPGIILTDQIGRSIKNLELRERPYMNLNNVKLIVGAKLNEDGSFKVTKSSKKSFPSNHSANIFFICSFFAFIYPKYKRYFFIIAVLISISRVYVGVHYPLDIIGGASIGIITSYFMQKMSNKLIRQRIIR